MKKTIEIDDTQDIVINWKWQTLLMCGHLYLGLLPVSD